MKKRALLFVLWIGAIGLPGRGLAVDTYAKTQFIPSVLVGLPHPWNLAADLRLPSHFSVGAGFGVLDYTFQNLIQNTPLRFGILNFEARLRWHPFKGAFFLGLGFGRQRLIAQANQDISVETLTVPTEVKMTQWCTYATPHIGWMWILNSRFALGFELGVQLPVASSTALSITLTDAALQDLLEQVQATSQYQQLEGDVTDRANQVGSTAFPFLTLLRLGYAF